MIFVKMDVDIADAPIPDGQILGLMARNNGRSCAHHHYCGSTVKVGSVAFFSFCIVLDKLLQELEDAIEVTMDCDLHPEGQNAELGFLQGGLRITKSRQRSMLIVLL